MEARMRRAVRILHFQKWQIHLRKTESEQKSSGSGSSRFPDALPAENAEKTERVFLMTV